MIWTQESFRKQVKYADLAEWNRKEDANDSQWRLKTYASVIFRVEF